MDQKWAFWNLFDTQLFQAPSYRILKVKALFTCAESEMKLEGENERKQNKLEKVSLKDISCFSGFPWSCPMFWNKQEDLTLKLN